MYPSEKTRKIRLMASGKRGEKLMRYVFGLGGSSVFPAAFIGLLIFSINTGANIKGAGFGKSTEAGRFQVRKVFGAIGVDKGPGKADVNTYCFDTEELSRYMRKWFADRGYSEN